MNTLSTDHLAYRYPVSIKGVVLIDGKIPLLKNERDEFELPGGKLELDEQPSECVCREIQEELNIIVEVEGIIDSWLYKITPDTHVVIVTYGCILKSDPKELAFSNEHKSLILASLDEALALNMPKGYKNSIATWITRKDLHECHNYE